MRFVSRCSNAHKLFESKNLLIYMTACIPSLRKYDLIFSCNIFMQTHDLLLSDSLTTLIYSWVELRQAASNECTGFT